MELMSWDDSQRFLQELNKRDKQPGWVYRLPWEAEWEYACRGAPAADKSESAFSYYFDKPTNQMQPEQANFARKGGLGRTCKVGSCKPNRLGLYDMHGNVWEWCDDAENAPDGPSYRVLRGGSWLETYGWAASRLARAPSLRQGNLGLRLARARVGKEDK